MPYVHNFRIDGNAVGDVSNIHVDYEDAWAQVTGDGGEVTSEREKGARLSVKFGTDGINSPGTLTDLRTLRDGIIPHTITFDDPNGDSWEFDVNWKRKVPLYIGLPGMFEAVTIEFTERA